MDLHFGQILYFKTKFIIANFPPCLNNTIVRNNFLFFNVEGNQFFSELHCALKLEKKCQFQMDGCTIITSKAKINIF